MQDSCPIEVDTTSSQIPTQSKQASFLSQERLHRLFHSLALWLSKDWRTHKYVFFAALLLLLTITSTMAYYLNYPRPELNADTPTYFHIVERIQAHGYLLVDSLRLPGYPLLIVFVYALAGQGNLMAVSIVQAILFVVATLAIYVLAIFVLGRAWLAFLIGLLVGTNLVLLSYVKPIMSEGLALWLLTMLVLAVVYFIRTLHVSAFWIAEVCMLLLVLTRPEWLYLPLPLFAYLLLVAVRRGTGRRFFRHALVALALIYAVMGSYVGINALANHYPGLTAIENLNLMGKVLQYNMQDEAPPQDASISHELDTYVARIDRDPYHVLPYIPSLLRDNASPAGNFARDIILRHPLEFLLKSTPLFFSSLTDYYASYRVNIPGPFDTPLGWLKSLHRLLYEGNACFPLCVLTWAFLLCWRRTKSHQAVLTMGALTLIALYGLIITTLGGYRPDDYMRFHIVFDPLLIVIVWGSLLMGALLIVQQGPTLLRRITRR